jgi:hypothetical protein
MIRLCAYGRLPPTPLSTGFFASYAVFRKSYIAYCFKSRLMTPECGQWRTFYFCYKVDFAWGLCTYAANGARHRSGLTFRDLLDTGLGGLALCLFRGDIPHGGMEPLTVVVSFDVGEQGVPGG